jgi:hypothetical protein
MDDSQKAIRETIGNVMMNNFSELVDYARLVADKTEKRTDRIRVGQPETGEVISGQKPLETYPGFFDDLREKHRSIRNSLERIENFIDRIEI